MSIKTKIHWCDSTINPVMGCIGCELLPPAKTVCDQIDTEISRISKWPKGNSEKLFNQLIDQTFELIETPKVGHENKLTATNVWHLRNIFLSDVKKAYGTKAKKLAEAVILSSLQCYAFKLHANRALSIVAPDRKNNIGYAPNFHTPTPFPGRMREAAKWPDLQGKRRPDKQWLDFCPRLIFISDMGDALCRSEKEWLKFLESEVIANVASSEGKRHVWLWLTKQPHIMAKFAQSIGGFPPNVCAMTTLTAANRSNRARLDFLRKTSANMRGLSIEPLWERIPADSLDLEGIDWVICGGESGSKFANPFEVDWALEIQQACQDQGKAFFLKQLGRKPLLGGKAIKLENDHGGDWTEWPDEVPRVRDIPMCICNYRPQELIPAG